VEVGEERSLLAEAVAVTTIAEVVVVVVDTATAVVVVVVVVVDTAAIAEGTVRPEVVVAGMATVVAVVVDTVAIAGAVCRTVAGPGMGAAGITSRLLKHRQPGVTGQFSQTGNPVCG
jgi:hypothetical protein